MNIDCFYLETKQVPAKCGIVINDIVQPLEDKVDSMARSLDDVVKHLLSEISYWRQLVHNQATEISELKKHLSEDGTQQPPPSKKLRTLAPRPQEPRGAPTTRVPNNSSSEGLTSCTEHPASAPVTKKSSEATVLHVDKSAMTRDSSVDSTPSVASSTLSSHDQPPHPFIEKFESNLSVLQMWIEYDEGLANLPPFRVLQETYGAKWRCGKLKGQWSKRCQLFQFIEKTIPGPLADKARRLHCREVASRLDRIRLSKDTTRGSAMSAGSFIDNIIKEINKKQEKIVMSETTAGKICKSKWSDFKELLDMLR